jgi:hypothetical protein
VATWEVVYFKITPNFMESSSAHAVAKARASGASEEAIAKKKTEMAEFAQMYRNPPINAGITFMEPLPVALIVSLISAGALSRRRKPGIAADPAVRGAPAAR